MELIYLLVGLLVLALVVAVFWWGMNQLTLPQPVRMVIMAVLAIAILLWLADGGLHQLAHFRL